MDWKVTARTRSPHVRVYTEEKDRVVLLLVDQRQNMFFGSRERLKSVTAAELAATVLDRAGVPGSVLVMADAVSPSRQAAAAILARYLATSDAFTDGRALGRGLKAARRHLLRSRLNQQKAAGVLPELNG